MLSICPWRDKLFRRSNIDKQLIVPCWTGNLANADKWKIAFAILVVTHIYLVVLRLEKLCQNSSEVMISIIYAITCQQVISNSGRYELMDIWTYNGIMLAYIILFLQRLWQQIPCSNKVSFHQKNSLSDLKSLCNYWLYILFYAYKCRGIRYNKYFNKVTVPWFSSIWVAFHIADCNTCLLQWSV